MAPGGYGNRVEGIHPVSAAARAGRVESLFVENGRRDRSEISSIIDLVGDDRVAMVDDVREIATTENPQGVVADCRPIRPLSLEGIRAGTDSVIVLDHIEDPHNVGAIARSALAAGVGALVVSSRRSSPLSAAAFKASAGALETIPVAVVSSIPDALKRLKDLGFWTVGLDPGGEQSLFGLDLLTELVAVVVGAEGQGISRLAAKRCDVLASIPMVGDTESLNASVSAALVAFEIMRVRSEGS